MQLEHPVCKKEKIKPVPPAAIKLMSDLTPYLQHLATILEDADVDEINLSLGALGTFHWRADFKRQGICPSRMQDPGCA